MKNQRYSSLRNKLVLPFSLLGFFVSALLCGITYGLVADLEHRAIYRMLHVEMDSFRGRLARNPDAQPPRSALVFGDFLPSPEFSGIPIPPADEELSFQLHEDGKNLTALVGYVTGTPYVLFYDRTVSDSNLVQLAWLLLGGTVLMTLLSSLVGYWLAGQVVRPINRLLEEIARKSAAIDPRKESRVGFSAREYPNNELGHLVLALDQFATRLFGFVQREGYFAADVSHEMRTPVAVIRGAVEVLIEMPDISAPVRDRLRAIQRQAVRLGEALEAMLILSSEDRHDGDPACAMSEVVEDAIADCMPSLTGRPVQILRQINDHPIVPVERPLAYVVIGNLLRNACAHTREGSITVRLFLDRLEIEDTGIGIAQDRFPDIFKRNVKGESSSGSGLGLSIVSRVTQRLGWRIEVDSQPGQGTRATVNFASAMLSD